MSKLPKAAAPARRLAMVLALDLGLALTVSTAAAGIDHVIHISVDGLRGDLLREMLHAPGENYPGFARLVSEGAATFNARCDYGSSETIPNHTSMITGLPLYAPPGGADWQQHGYYINYLVPDDTLHTNGLPVAYKPSVFDRVHDRGGRTMLLASKEKFRLFDRSYNADHGWPDSVGEDNGTDKIDFTLIQNGDSTVLVAVLLANMNGEFPAYTFMHFFDPDYAGHLYGWGSMNWQLAVKHADSLIGLILSALDLRPALKASTALIITSDHGGGVPAWNHIDPLHLVNVTIPVMIWGTGVPAGVDAHSLFSNRHDPPHERPENDAPQPPLRNGDTGNIALALLGMPPVTGSFYHPFLAGELRVTPISAGQIQCSWPLFWYGWSLEASPALDEASWAPVAIPPEAVGDRWVVHEPAAPEGRRYYRMRPPAD